MKIGLFFGSFNPFHIGHKLIGSYISEFTNLDKVLFVVSPQNPFKEKKSLLEQNHRLQIIRADIEDSIKLGVSDIEFHLPNPSYTIDTLVKINEKNPENEYSIIIGSDNLSTLHKWKNYKQILENYSIYVYPRHGFEFAVSHKNIHLINEAPKVEISASFIRKSIRERKDVSYLIPEKAWKYISEMNFYK
tara:strand:+ start:3309 stop:3878 length:570 start_codon:yes stop_codon:yes gene_type:complete